MLLLEVTSSTTVCRRDEAADRSRAAPDSVRQPASTRSPRASSCRASRLPKPESQPVISTNFSSRPGTVCRSRCQRRSSHSPSSASSHSHIPGQQQQHEEQKEEEEVEEEAAGTRWAQRGHGSKVQSSEPECWQPVLTLDLPNRAGPVREQRCAS